MHSKSLFERCCELIDRREGLYHFDPQGTAKALTLAEQTLGVSAGVRVLMRFLIRIMEHYAREATQAPRLVSHTCLCNFAVLSQRVSTIIAEDPHFRGQNHAEAAGLCIQMGRACLAVRDFELAENLLGYADAYCAADDHVLRESILSLMADLYTQWSAEERLIPILELLIVWREVNLQQDNPTPALDLDVRQRIAQECQGQGKYGFVRHWLEPTLPILAAITSGDETAKSNLTFTVGAETDYLPVAKAKHLDVLKAIADSYLAEGKYDEARTALRDASGLYPKAFSQNPQATPGTVIGFVGEEKRLAARVLLEDGRDGVITVADLPGELMDREDEIDTWNVGMTLCVRVVSSKEDDLEVELLSLTQCECGETEDVCVTEDPFASEIHCDHTRHAMCPTCIESSADNR